MTDIQSHSMNSNSNTIEQMYSVEGDTSQYSKKEYLIKRKADKRYRDLLKAAKKANMSPLQFTTQTFDCTVDEYCGSDYIQSKVFQGFTPSLNEEQIKTIKKVNTKVRAALPFYVKMKDIHIIIQATLYNALQSVDTNIYYMPDQAVSLKKQVNNHCSSKIKMLVRNKIGTENYVNHLYYMCRTDDKQTYVNIVDFISKHMEFTHEVILEYIKDDEVSIDFENKSFKKLTELYLTHRLIHQNLFTVNDPRQDRLLDSSSLWAESEKRTIKYFQGKATPSQVCYNSIIY